MLTNLWKENLYAFFYFKPIPVWLCDPLCQPGVPARESKVLVAPPLPCSWVRWLDQSSENKFNADLLLCKRKTADYVNAFIEETIRWWINIVEFLFLFGLLQDRTKKGIFSDLVQVGHHTVAVWRGRAFVILVRFSLMCYFKIACSASCTYFFLKN